MIIISKANVSYELYQLSRGFWNFQIKETSAKSNQSVLAFNADGPYVGMGVARASGNILIEKPGLYFIMGTLTVTGTTGAPVISVSVAGNTPRGIINMNCPSGGSISFSTGVDITVGSTVVGFSAAGGAFSIGSIGPQCDLTVVRLA